MRESIKINFKDIKLKAVFFLYVKCLWAYAKKLGLTNHKYLKTRKLIIFILKIITLIKSEEHENIIVINCLNNEFNN